MPWHAALLQQLQTHAILHTIGCIRVGFKVEQYASKLDEVYVTQWF